MTWNSIIASESKKPYFEKIQKFLIDDAKYHTIYPNKDDIFNAFKLCPFHKTKVVILGQDPYINPNQAHGLSFSVPHGQDIPPSLRNIYKELKSDLNIDPPNHGNLTKWAEQGVLLLNSILTVRKSQSGAHAKIGWEIFTDQVIRELDEKEEAVVFILWGLFAKKKKELITNQLIIEGGHPSPLSQKLFFGGKYFSKCNQLLTINHQTPIDWTL